MDWRRPDGFAVQKDAQSIFALRRTGMRGRAGLSRSASNRKVAEGGGVGDASRSKSLQSTCTAEDPPQFNLARKGTAAYK